MCSLFCVQRPLTSVASSLGSFDGHALPIDKLKGTKPTKEIDLSGKGLKFTSAIIIASCIKENGVLRALKCAVCPSVLAFLSAPLEHLHFLCTWQPPG